MILEKSKNWCFKVISKSIVVAQKCKKKGSGQNFFAFLNFYQPKTQLIEIHNSLDSYRPYGSLL